MWGAVLALISIGTNIKTGQAIALDTAVIFATLGMLAGALIALLDILFGNVKKEEIEDEY